MYQEEGHRKASTTAKTALGLGIGALGVELLGGLGGFLRGNPAMVCNNDAAIYEAEIREISRLNDARQAQPRAGDDHRDGVLRAAGAAQHLRPHHDRVRGRTGGHPAAGRQRC